MAGTENSPPRQNLLGRLRSRFGAGDDTAARGTATRLPGLPAEAARLLPYLEADMACSACGAMMSLQGPGTGGQCNSCSGVAGEALGVYHECMTCGRRSCPNCSQTQAVRAEAAAADRSVAEVAAEAVYAYVEEASEANEARTRVAAELVEAQGQFSAAASEALAEQTAALASREALSERIEAESAAAENEIEALRANLNERTSELGELRVRLEETEGEIAAAPRPEPVNDEDPLQEARTEVTQALRLAAERRQQAEEHRGNATAATALEARLRSELAEHSEMAASARAQRLGDLAELRAELGAERLATEKADAKAAVEAAADAETAAAAAAAAEAEPADNPRRSLIDRFLGKIEDFVMDSDVPISGFGDVGDASNPIDRQVGLPADFYYGWYAGFGGGCGGGLVSGLDGRSEEFNMMMMGGMGGNGVAAASGSSSTASAGASSETNEWAQRAAACEKQLEWMRRDASRRAAEAAALCNEVASLREELVRSASTAVGLSDELETERQQMRAYHQRLRRQLRATVITSRERILGAIRNGSTQTSSELEALFDDSCDWACPVSAPSVVSTGTGIGGAAMSLPDIDIVEGEGLTKTLSALCDELERAAADAAEESMTAPTSLCDVVCAFNAASEAKEAGDAWPGAASRPT
eukprot:NODE_1918_length_2336_cov_9.035763.p1 GENE.NODE_1918_length_2336_cov_9.035763~~NODE_1918_length_2336_cov_9.035763.p1  ORF type:complete len:647 (+),score=180.58 NODE_1918_length_2336_cov_9.035763:89-2029(+)